MLQSMGSHCAGKAGNPFQRKQVNRLSCSDQEGRRDSDELVPVPSLFPSRELGVSGYFWGVASIVASTISHFKMERGTSLETL